MWVVSTALRLLYPQVRLGTDCNSVHTARFNPQRNSTYGYAEYIGGMENLERHEMTIIKGDFKVNAGVKSPNSRRATRLFHWRGKGLTMRLYINLIYVYLKKCVIKSCKCKFYITLLASAFIYIQM